MAVPYSAAYTATKHAVVGFTRALREEARPRGVRMHVVRERQPEMQQHIPPWLFLPILLRYPRCDQSVERAAASLAPLVAPVRPC